MGRMIRLDRTGHSTVAEWAAHDERAKQEARDAFARELERGFIASATLAGGSAEVVRELPLDAELVTLRRPIVGG
ncbi:MAG: hypothetical protein M3Y34_08770 [Actinomycetota bacterium]|nr:hypothetical protein [Actinomycetota bacterium]